MLRLIIFTIILFGSISPSVSAEDNSNKYSQSTYGGIGLIETPTARFSLDGEMAFGISSESPYNRLFAKMQFFPWLESVITGSSYNWITDAAGK